MCPVRGCAEPRAGPARPAAPLPGRISGLAVEVLGLSTGLRQHPGPPHQPAAPLDEAHIAGHRHDILDALGLQAFEDLGAGKPAVPPNPENRLREGGPEPGAQAPQQPDRAVLGRAVARAQHGGDRVLRRLGIERQRRDQRQHRRGALAVDAGVDDVHLAVRCPHDDAVALPDVDDDDRQSDRLLGVVALGHERGREPEEQRG